jgi:molybdopterin-guanine dinucleotide biosynthesis protein A
MNYLSAVLLAGGESRRMGQDKATLIYRDAPLWRRQLDLLRKLEPDELFVSARTDPVWRPADTLFVADVPPSRGPLSGLVAALDRTKGTHLLALAVDMPCMNEAYLRSLCQLVEADRGIVPVIEERSEPLAAIYPIEALAHFQEALAGSDFSLQRVVSRLVSAEILRGLPIRPEEKKSFHNLNEIADLFDAG